MSYFASIPYDQRYCDVDNTENLLLTWTRKQNNFEARIRYINHKHLLSVPRIFSILAEFILTNW